MFKCGPHFPVFGLNTGKYGPEKTYRDTFHAVILTLNGITIGNKRPIVETFNNFLSILVPTKCSQPNKRTILYNILTKKFLNTNTSTF